MKYLLADRQQSARSALRLLLDQYSRLKYIGESDNLPNLLMLIQENKPELLLVEWEILGCWPKGEIAAIRAINPMTVVVLSCCVDRRKASLDAGADYYVSKGENPEHLMAVLESVTSGKDEE